MGFLKNNKDAVIPSLLILFLTTSFLLFQPAQATARFRVRLSTVPLASNQQYQGTRSCTPCHEKIVTHWQTTAHAQALHQLPAQDQQNSRCLRCHTTGYGTASGYKKGQPNKIFASVGCESCHGPLENHIQNPKEPLSKQQKEETCQTCVIRKQCMLCHTKKESPNFTFTSYYEKIKHNP